MQFNLMYFNVSIQSNAFVLSAEIKKAKYEEQKQVTEGYKRTENGRARPEQGFLLLPLNYI